LQLFRTFFTLRGLIADGEVDYVSLTSSQILSLENKKKNKFSFCILLAYSYLCNVKAFDMTRDECIKLLKK